MRFLYAVVQVLPLFLPTTTALLTISIRNQESSSSSISSTATSSTISSSRSSSSSSSRSTSSTSTASRKSSTSSPTTASSSSATKTTQSSTKSSNSSSSSSKTTTTRSSSDVSSTSLSSSLLSTSSSSSSSTTSSSFITITTSASRSATIGGTLQFENNTTVTTTNTVSPSATCAAPPKYANLTASVWKADRLDNWLEGWTNKSVESIMSNPNGFIGAFGDWALGNSNTTCNISDGDSYSCDFTSCSLNSSAGNSSEKGKAYAVLRGIQTLSNSFRQLRLAFTTNNITIFRDSQTDFQTQFYQDIKRKNFENLAGTTGAAATVSQLVTILYGFGNLNNTRGGGALIKKITGGIASVYQILDEDWDTSSTTSIMDFVVGRTIRFIQTFTDANDALMSGRNVEQTGNINDFIRNGTILSGADRNVNNLTGQVSLYLTAKAINSMWRAQKIYIMGGGSCNDSDGMGTGPQNRKICRNGKAWYLYWWQEQDGQTSVRDHSWGWVEDPPGAAALGLGPYKDISVADVINSSLDSYLAGGNNYTYDLALNRAAKGDDPAARSPLINGPSHEGVFTIPVCDIGLMANESIYGKEYILQPYGGDYRPVWCGPICGKKAKLTRAFIKAANMENFESPVHYCTGNLPWQCPSDAGLLDYCSATYSS